MPNANDYALKANVPQPQGQVKATYDAMLKARVRYDQARRENDPDKEIYFNQFLSLYQAYNALMAGWQDDDYGHPEKAVSIGMIVLMLALMVCAVLAAVWLEIGGRP